MRVLDWAEKHIKFRRLVVVWVCAMITVAVLRGTRPEVMAEMTTPAATVITGTLGLLATGLGFYGRKRKKNDDST